MTPAIKPTIGFLRGDDFIKRRRLFLGRAANLADHHDRLGLIIGQKHFKNVNVLGAFHRVAANTDTGGLPKARHRV